MTANPRQRSLGRRSPRRIGAFIVPFLPPAVGLLILSTALFTSYPSLVVGIATWVGSARPTALLARLSASSDVRSQPALRRSTRLLVVGSILTAASTIGSGATAAIAPDVTVMDVPLPAEIPNVGLCLASLAYVSGLLLLPGATVSPLGRVRQLLDGTGVGISALFVFWVTSFAGHQILGGALTSALVASITIGIATIAGVWSSRAHRARLVSGLGIILSVAGLSILAIVQDFLPWGRTMVLALLCAGVALTVAPTLIWLGASQSLGDPPQAAASEDDDVLSTYPLLALPLAAAIAVSIYHIIHRRSFDTTSLYLAIAGVTLVALREALAAFDIRRYATQLTAQRARYQSLFAGSSEVTIVLDDSQTVLWQSPAAARLLGLSDQEVVGRSFLRLFHPEDADRLARTVIAHVFRGGARDEPGTGEARMRDGYGGWRDVELRLIDHRASAEIRALVAHVRDITERKDLERSLREAAFADQLTALPTRRKLLQAIAVRDEPGVISVLCLDGVEGVSDMHGRDIADGVLIEAARRLRDGVGEGDIPVRLDGDRFAVVSPCGAIQAQIMATRLLTALAEPYELRSISAYVSARAGLAELEPDGGGRIDADQALRRAELALRRAKRRGKGGALEWYEASMDEAVRRQLAIEQELPGAIRRGEMDVRFQPVVDLLHDRPVGAEAVVTWRHPTIGAVGVEELLPVAEEMGIGPDMQEWILHRVCRQMSEWQRDHRELWISVDVSADQLAGPELVATAALALEAHQVPGASLVLEVPEAGLRRQDPSDPSADARSEAIVSALADLRSLGIRIALDHFGTETTSLNRLRLLPVDLLKVDRKLFIEPVAHSANATAIVDVMVRFGHQLGLEVVAQGLEDDLDVAMVKRAGCQYGQGTPFSAPVPAEYFEVYFDSHRAQRF